MAFAPLSAGAEFLSDVLQIEVARRKLQEDRKEDRARTKQIVESANFEVRRRGLEAKKLLASQRSQFAAAGVSAQEGSPLLLQLQDLAESSLEREFILAGAAREVQAERRRRRSSKRQEKLTTVGGGTVALAKQHARTFEG